jgi:Helix-turn-helix domain
MADIGARLREARMRARIDINEVETRTKIRAKYLRALENEEWDLLPGEVYVKSFLRTYGEFLGLDTRQLLDEFKRRYEHPSDHELRPLAPLGQRERERQARGPLIPPWAAIGAVLIVVVVVLYLLGINNGGPGKSSSTPSTSARNTQTTRSNTNTTTGTNSTSHRAVPRLVRLQLTATGQVYVCLVNGHGRKLIAGQIYQVGEKIPSEAGAKLLLTLGNASVKMKVNGVAVPVAASSGSIGFMFTPTAHTSLPQAKQPTCA